MKYLIVFFAQIYLTLITSAFTEDYAQEFNSRVSLLRLSGFSSDGLSVFRTVWEKETEKAISELSLAAIPDREKEIYINEILMFSVLSGESSIGDISSRFFVTRTGSCPNFAPGYMGKLIENDSKIADDLRVLFAKNILIDWENVQNFERMFSLFTELSLISDLNNIVENEEVSGVLVEHLESHHFSEFILLAENFLNSEHPVFDLKVRTMMVVDLKQKSEDLSQSLESQLFASNMVARVLSRRFSLFSQGLGFAIAEKLE